MSLEDTFDSNLGNYAPSPSPTSPATVGWDGTLGNPAPGSIKLHAEMSSVPEYFPAYIANNVDTHLVATGEDLYFNGRFQTTVPLTSYFSTLIFYVRLEFTDAASIDVLYYGFNLIPSGLDSGWLQFNIDLSSREGKTCNLIKFGLLEHSAYNSVVGALTAYIDSVDFSTTTPPFSPNPTYQIAKCDSGVWSSVLNNWADDICVAFNAGIATAGVRSYKAVRKSGSGVSFYSGDGVFTLRSSPSVPSVRQATMAVKEDGSVLLGSDVAGAVLVLRGSKGDDYATWTDLTGTLPNTNSIRGVIFI